MTGKIPASKSLNPIKLANRSYWETAATKVTVGSIARVVVKHFDAVTRQIECGFADDLTDALHFKSNLTGIAFAVIGDDPIATYSPGTKLQALVLAFDPVAKAFCLTVDPKHTRVYRRNFEAKFRDQSTLKLAQVIKGENP